MNEGKNVFRDIFKTYGVYARFPLPLLAFAAEREALVRVLRRYSIVAVGRVINQRADPFELPFPNKLPKGFVFENRHHRAIGAAMVRMKRIGGSMKKLRQTWNSSRQFLSATETLKGHPLVSVSMALLCDTSNTALTERDLRVLLACNSCFGEKGWNIINWKTISRRAVGAKDEEALRRLGVKPLSRRQVQLALEKLQRRGLIRRVLLDNRITFASTGQMKQEDLESIVTGWRKRRERAGKAVFAVSSKKRGCVQFERNGDRPMTDAKLKRHWDEMEGITTAPDKGNEDEDDDWDDDDADSAENW